MGTLAQFVKRKRDRENGIHNESTKNVLSVTTKELELLRSSTTRTAKRKLKKWLRLLEDGNAIEISPPEEVNDEEEDDDDHNGENSDRIHNSNPSEAYEALLRSLAKTQGGDVAEAYKRRKKELEGRSESESDNESDEDDISDDLYGKQKNEKENNAHPASERVNMMEQIQENNVHKFERPSSEKNLETMVENGKHEKKDGDNDIRVEKTPNTDNILHETSKDALDALDQFEHHLDMTLTEDDVSSLAFLREKSNPFKTMVSKEHHLQAWLPNAVLQSSEKAMLPNISSNNLANYGVRSRLVSLWREVHEKDRSLREDERIRPDNRCGDFSSKKQQALFAILNSYCDVLYPVKKYPLKYGLIDEEMDAVLLHALNHIARTADKIKKNNEVASRSSGDTEQCPRDQGFTRPKVLLLTPFRNMAFQIVSRLLSFALKETRTDSIQRKERFRDEFGDDEDEALVAMSDRMKNAWAKKPAEHRAIFHGNIDDHFRLGIKLTRGAARLFSDFYDSDILVCSPLALATKLEEAPADGAPHGDNIDYLSSIEIVVVDRADVILMQNWKHLQTVMESLNQIPSDQRNIDIMRLREWYLTGHAQHYRQTIMLSSFISPEMSSIIGRTCSNHAGAVRLSPIYKGVLGSVVHAGVRLIFERIPLRHNADPSTVLDARFEHFKSALWPRIRESAKGGGQLIYIPSYFDYVRVRNFLRSEQASFVGLCEYTDRKDMSRARSYFADGRRRVLLYTERAQFYNRHRIRGIKDILFYQLPEHPQFYLELANWIEDSGAASNTKGSPSTLGMATATASFTKFDLLRLERIVGTDRAALMLRKSKQHGQGLSTSGSHSTGTFMFC